MYIQYLVQLLFLRKSLLHIYKKSNIVWNFKYEGCAPHASYTNFNHGPGVISLLNQEEILYYIKHTNPLKYEVHQLMYETNSFKY